MAASDPLPAIVPPTALAPAPTGTRLVPALIADAGEQVSWRYVGFFTANIGGDLEGPDRGQVPARCPRARRKPDAGARIGPSCVRVADASEPVPLFTTKRCGNDMMDSAKTVAGWRGTELPPTHRDR